MLLTCLTGSDNIVDWSLVFPLFFAFRLLFLVPWLGFSDVNIIRFYMNVWTLPALSVCYIDRDAQGGLPFGCIIHDWPQSCMDWQLVSQQESCEFAYVTLTAKKKKIHRSCQTFCPPHLVTVATVVKRVCT